MIIYFISYQILSYMLFFYEGKWNVIFWIICYIENKYVFFYKINVNFHLYVRKSNSIFIQSCNIYIRFYIFTLEIDCKKYSQIWSKNIFIKSNTKKSRIRNMMCRFLFWAWILILSLILSLILDYNNVL